MQSAKSQISSTYGKGAFKQATGLTEGAGALEMQTNKVEEMIETNKRIE